MICLTEMLLTFSISIKKRALYGPFWSFDSEVDRISKSVKESNSFPNSDVPLINLAILPSKASKIAANKINVTDKLKFPSIENLMELIPRHTPAKVKIFGNNGMHARAAVSANSLPLGVAVEVDCIFELN